MSLDIIRGIVMVLMALDHVRVFAAVPAGGAPPSVFLTRWVTNFCVPAFVFLAGTGAFLHGEKLGNKRALSRFLLVRGALLVFLEMTVSRFGWTFNFDFYNYTEANVLWAIGWCMILLAGLIHLPFKGVALFGIAVIVLQHVLDLLPNSTRDSLYGSSLSGLWQVVYGLGEFRFFGSGPMLVVLYTIVPWIGVIAIGYAFGRVMQFDTARRHKWCYRIGLGATAIFVVVVIVSGIAGPKDADNPSGVMSILRLINPRKYPASLLFLMMTLGPTIASIPLFENARGRIAGWLALFGRVPLFYYLLHIPFIHLVAVVISMVRTPDATSWLFLNHPLRIPPAPDGYRWSLPMLYAVTAGVVIALYFPCRWFSKLKASRRDSWLSYF